MSYSRRRRSSHARSRSRSRSRDRSRARGRRRHRRSRSRSRSPRVHARDRGRERDRDRRSSRSRPRARSRSRDRAAAARALAKTVKAKEVQDQEEEEEEEGAIPETDTAIATGVEPQPQPPQQQEPAADVQPKRVPISLEDLAAKRDAAEKELARPKYISKEERQRLKQEEAMLRLQQKRQHQKQHTDIERQKAKQFVTAAEANQPKTASEIAVSEVRKKELELIKEGYLGKSKAKKKKKLVPPSQKFKFVFDWDIAEDTSTDLNPIYNRKHDISLGFGRGFFAGMDRDEQKKGGSRAYNDLQEKRAQYLESVKDESVVRRRQERTAAITEKKRLQSRHWSEKKLSEMMDRDWRIFNEDFNIVCRGGSMPHGLRNWQEANLPDSIMTTLKRVGYEAPTPIQRAAIPIGQSGRDLLAVAETGSGKTCAFIIPMLLYILKLGPITRTNAADGPYAVILAPTRELAQQIDEETNKFSRPLGFRTVCVVGGVAVETQAYHIREGCEIIVATPGRLNDCLRKRFLVLNQCNYIVLDEADRMMDMGFEEQVVTILDAMPASNLRPEDDSLAESDRIYRTTFMFSATMPPTVERLAREYLRKPAYVTIGDRGGTAVDRIEQRVEYISEGQKRSRLMQILATAEPPIIVFMNQKKSCDVLARILNAAGHSSTVMHGGKIQEQREHSLEGFKSGRYDILVATDVAGRGIDVQGVTHVINYDMPKNIEYYTHRIGRTGRAGKQGIATSFLTSADTDIMLDLKKMLNATNSKVPPELLRHEATKPQREVRLG